MKSNHKIRYLAVLIAIVFVAIIIIFNSFQKDMWDINADKLIKSFQVISGDADIEDLSRFIPFEWDELYSFAPYTSKKTIYETIGYKWDRISETVDESMNQMVFVKDDKEVCYLYGYSNIYFDFGDYKGYFIKLTPSNNLYFKTKLSNNGVRYFKYIQ